MKEQWKPIPDFPDYKVSSTGLVQSYKMKLPRILKTAKHPGGYRTVLLRRNGETHCFRVGHLVLLAFHGSCPDGCEMCHNDGDAANDHLDNLRWDTHLSNMQDAAKHGKVGRPKSPSTLAKMREKTRIAIERESFAKTALDMQKKMTDSISLGMRIKILRSIRGINQGDLAEKLEIPQVTLSYIENDRIVPTPKRMVAILTELGWSEQTETAFEILAGDGHKIASQLAL